MINTSLIEIPKWRMIDVIFMIELGFFYLCAAKLKSGVRHYAYKDDCAPVRQARLLVAPRRISSDLSARNAPWPILYVEIYYFIHAYATTTYIK